jgi:hypothetical protein
MPLFFNRAGLSVAGKHYIINLLQRIDVNYIKELSAEESYFVLQAPHLLIFIIAPRLPGKIRLGNGQCYRLTG